MVGSFWGAVGGRSARPLLIMVQLVLCFIIAPPTLSDAGNSVTLDSLLPTIQQMFDVEDTALGADLDQFRGVLPRE